MLGKANASILSSILLTNGDKSTTFPLHRPVQQGCPLSPAPLQHLALRIRSHPNTVGLKVGGMETLISLYADDVILYIQNSNKSVLPLLDLITCFVMLSGFTTNWTKSDLMPLVNVYTPGFLESVPFKMINDHLT